MKILILEDEHWAYEKLSNMIKEIEASAHILAVQESIQDTISWLKNNAMPDLIFSDIHLADGSSFLIFEQIPITCPIIFTTAYDEYALKAFSVNSIDYLLKPINKEELSRALNKYKNQNQSVTTLNAVLNNLLSTQKNYKERFLVKYADKLISIPTTEVDYFVSEDKYVMLYQKSKKYPIDFTIEELENLLNPNRFHKLNRKMITNINAIDKIHSHLNGKIKVEVSPSYSEEIFVSREKAQEFKNWLDGM
ncbi:MAG: LytTR family DNA-binding domain-containing protein [Cytophagales bacterium]